MDPTPSESFPHSPQAGEAVRMHGLRAKCNDGFDRKALHSLGEATHHQVHHAPRSRSRGAPQHPHRDRGSKSSSVVVLDDKKEGPVPSRRDVTPRGWAVGMPYSAATARTRLRNGAVPQRLCAAPSSPHVPTHCSFSHAGSHAPLRVARSLVAFLVATLLWPPDRYAAGLDFLWGAEARGGRHLVSSGGLLPAGTGVDTSLEQYVERLNRDRTTVRHWQSPIVTPEGYSGTPRQPTPRLLGQLLCENNIPFTSGSSTRLGRGTLAGSTNAPYVAS